MIVGQVLQALHPRTGHRNDPNLVSQRIVPVISASAVFTALAVPSGQTLSLGSDGLSLSVGTQGVNVNIQRIWSDGSLYEMRGDYGGKQVDVEIRSFGNGSFATVAGRVGDTPVDLRVDDIWNDATNFNVTGRVGNTNIWLSASGSWPNGFNYMVSGRIGTTSAYMNLTDIQFGGGWYRLNGEIGPNRLDLDLHDVWRDGSYYRVSGSATGS